MTTFSDVTYDQFKGIVQDFMAATIPQACTMSNDEIDAGEKCVILHYAGRSKSWSNYEQRQARVMLDLVDKRAYQVSINRH